MVQVQDAADKPAHLLSFIKRESSAKFDLRLTSPVTEGWVMFNDFSVRMITAEQATSFPAAWKIPAIIIYERADSAEVLQLDELPSHLDRAILSKDVSLAW